MLSLRRPSIMRPAARVAATQMRHVASSANGGATPLPARPDPFPRPDADSAAAAAASAEEHSLFQGNGDLSRHPRPAAAAAADAPPVIHLVADAAAVQAACAKLGQAAQLCVDIEALRYVAPEEDKVAAGAAGGRLGRISTVQVMGVSHSRMVTGAAAAGAPEVFVFDVLSLGAEAVAPALRALLEREDQVKLLYDFRGDFVALDGQLGVALPKQSTVDVQLMCVAQRWTCYGAAGRPGLGSELRRLLSLSEPQLAAVAAGRLRMEEGGGGADENGGGADSGCEAWEERPMPADLLAYAASGVLHLPALWMATLAHHEHARELTRRTRAALLRGAPAEEVEEAPAAAASGRPHAVPQELLLETVGPAGACPTCKQPGHTPDRCRMGRICEFCGAAGHVKADCFKWRAAVERGEGEDGAVPVRPVLVCDYCGATGHDEAHCFKKTKQVCEHCGEAGHRASTCRHIVPCAKCGELGHIADACPSDAKGLRGVEPSREKAAGGARELVCTFCGGRGHDAQHCFKRLKTKCAHCGETGHTEKTCRHIVPCTHCGAVGHMSKKCPQLAGAVPARDTGGGDDGKACDKEAP